MDNFKLASQQKLRYQSEKGPLTTENLWDLTIPDLDKLALNLQKEYDQSAPASFLTKKTAKDKTAKLRFDVVLDVLTTKVAESEAATDASERREHNKRIDALIAEKTAEEQKKKSIKELKGMYK